jgi:hypothetical protein
MTDAVPLVVNMTAEVSAAESWIVGVLFSLVYSRNSENDRDRNIARNYSSREQFCLAMNV